MYANSTKLLRVSLSQGLLSQGFVIQGFVVRQGGASSGKPTIAMLKTSSSTSPRYASDEASVPRKRFAVAATSFQSHRQTASVVDAKLLSWARPRLNRHWTHHGAPNISLLLCILDLVFVGGALSFVFATYQDVLQLTGLAHAALIVGLLLSTSMGFLYALGGYRWDTVVARGVETSCLPVAIGFSAAASFLTIHFVESVLNPSMAVSLGVVNSIGIVALSAGLTLVMMILSRRIFYAMLDREWFRRRVLVVGTGDRATYLRKLMAQNAHRLANDLWFISDSIVGGASKFAPEELSEFMIAADGTALNVLAQRLGMDEIIIAADDLRVVELPTLLACKLSGIPVTHYDAFIERETGRVDLGHLEVSHLVYSGGFRMRSRDVAIKRFLDIVLSLAMLFVCLPVMVAAAVALSLEGYRPIIFKQERVTLGGRAFWLYKLRTMRPDAEQNGPQWSVQGDTRVTRVGAILRRTRIDELPQLLNVLRGDMSLVGPRPERPIFVEQLSKEIQMYDLRHSVKSGLTGWAQINYPYGASSEDAARKLEYDLYYIKNYSLTNDVSIVLQTLRVVLWPPVQRS